MKIPCVCWILLLLVFGTHAAPSVSRVRRHYQAYLQALSDGFPEQEASRPKQEASREVLNVITRAQRKSPMQTASTAECPLDMKQASLNDILGLFGKAISHAFVDRCSFIRNPGSILRTAAEVVKNCSNGQDSSKSTDRLNFFATMVDAFVGLGLRSGNQKKLAEECEVVTSSYFRANSGDINLRDAMIAEMQVLLQNELLQARWQ